MTLDRGRYYFVLNVPKHLIGKVLGKGGQSVRQVQQARRTADLSVAKRRAFELEELKRSEWHLLELGEEALAHEKFAAAKRIAESQGFEYVPAEVLLRRSFQENLPRLMAAAGTVAEPTAPAVTEALLGGVDVALPPLRTVFEEFVALTKTKHMRKSDRQRHLWRLPRDRAVVNFEKAVPKRARAGIDRITREDALAFRAWWAQRIEDGETRAETANKDFGHRSQIFRTWCELKGHGDLEYPFARLRFDNTVDPLVTRPAFSRDWVADQLLASHALDGLNDEAADALLVLVNSRRRARRRKACPRPAGARSSRRPSQAWWQRPPHQAPARYRGAPDRRPRISADRVAGRSAPGPSGCIGGKDPDLTVLDPPRRAGILPRDTDRMGAFLKKSGLIDDQNAIPIGRQAERPNRPK